MAVTVETPHGPARVHLRTARRPRGALVLGHGAGGGISSGDLVAASDVALEEGLTVALVEQPYRVAGRRSPAPAHQLDTELKGLPIVVGGRSSGARVACRTAEATGAVAVLCLAFPLRPPRRSGTAQSRLHELDEVSVPTLVVQGAQDPFGVPPSSAKRVVARVKGNHSLRSDLPAVAEAVREWLSALLQREGRPEGRPSTRAESPLSSSR